MDREDISVISIETGCIRIRSTTAVPTHCIGGSVNVKRGYQEKAYYQGRSS
jgi:hypothetical protein